MTFLADCMLGKLARWLRILGYDTLYFRDIGDDELLEIARHSERVLLTRDTQLFSQIPSGAGVFIEHDHIADQLKQVLCELQLEPPTTILTRCLRCNAVLERIEKALAEASVPEFIYHAHADFSRCPQCGKIYWKGSHYAHIHEALKQLLSI